MLVQALAGYADTYLQRELGDPAFEEKGVHFLVEIDSGGSFLGIAERVEIINEDTTSRKPRKPKTRVLPLLVPRSPINRNSTVFPLLACDAIQYVVGPSPGHWTAEKKDDAELAKHARHHDAFRHAISVAAASTKDVALAACAKFCDDTEAIAKARAALEARNPKPGTLVALALRPTDASSEDVGGPVISRDVVKTYWRRVFKEQAATRVQDGEQAMCLVSGELGPVAVTHDKIKGLARLGGQPAGVSLMSFDKQAFQSYGWDKNANSPVSPDRANAYVLALNDLLHYGEHRQGRSRDKVLRTRSDHAGVAHIFWTAQPSDDDPYSLFEQAQPKEIDKLLNSPYVGDARSLQAVDTNLFYVVGVSGNGGRLVVRYWLRESLDVVRANLRRWFHDLRVADVYQQGRACSPPRLRDLLSAVSPPHVEPDDSINAERGIRLLRRAFEGTATGYDLLRAALARLRVESGSARLEPHRIALVRMCVNDLAHQQKKEKVMNESLDPALDHPAYVCGRLLALYDALQYTAQGEVNATVADRYYAMASSYPQLAFPKLEQLSRAHLKKLNRKGKAAARVAIEREIDALSDLLSKHGGRYPAHLSIEDQGRFAIGFHHQKAEEQRRIAEAKAKKQESTES